MSRIQMMLVVSFGFSLAAQAGQPPRFHPVGTRLVGHQLAYDAAFFVTDWDGDRTPDMILPTGSMINSGVLLNRGTPTAPRFGSVMPYDLNSTEMMPQTVEHASSWCVGDLNDDGLPDAILFDGYLRLAVNTGTAQGPNLWSLWAGTPTYFPGSRRMVEENARFSTGPESMNWKRGIFARQAVTVAIADWDNDGLNDVIVSRFKAEAPGVTSAGAAYTQWTALGRMIAGASTAPPTATNAPSFRGALEKAPERGLYVYRNLGVRSRPWFDAGQEVLTVDGASIAAPNPELADVDGDGVPDLVSSEVPYACNAYRVDWPTAPTVVWFRRTERGMGTRVEASRPVMDKNGKPIPAGVAARLADLRADGVKDLLVLDPARGIRWYPRVSKDGAFQAPTVIRGEDFARFYFIYQPMVANWFGPASRDLILHGSTDHHCKWDLRRTALYRNRATAPGGVDYEFTGFMTYRGDPEMVPKSFEESQMAVYGSAAWAPECPDGKKRLLMSVEGQVYLFTKLAEDGLTFQERQKLAIPIPGRNRCTGWQELPVAVTGDVRYIRLTPGGGKGNLGLGGLAVVAFEALDAGRSNVATWAAGARVAPAGSPAAMLTPGNMPEKGGYTSFDGPAMVTLPAPARVNTLRFLLYDGSLPVTSSCLPFYWQGTLYPFGFGATGERWYQYKIEVSADAKEWTTVADRLPTEMLRSFPCAVDWNGDGRFDLVLGVLNGQGLTPATREYRLYLNGGDNDHPVFDKFSSLCLEDGKPLRFPASSGAYDNQCGVIATDLNGDGKPDLVLGETRVSMTYYENVSASAGDYRFKRVKELGDPQPIRCTDENRTFFVGDVDGDGITDLIQNNSASIYFSWGPVLFKGAAAAAPAPAADLAVAAVSAEGVAVQWRRPAGAERYDLRWSTGEDVTDLTWVGLKGSQAAYAVGEGATQTVTLAVPPSSEPIRVAVRSMNAAGEASPLSNPVEAVRPPLRRVALCRGVSIVPGGPAYTNAAACVLDGARPDAASSGAPTLTLRAAARGPAVILVRFDRIPMEAPVESAVLELSMPGGAPVGPIPPWVTCSAFRDDWDPVRVTYTHAAPGKPWAEDELIAGGEFLSRMEPMNVSRPDPTCRWDVTRAVQAAQRAGRDTVSLLLRRDYTGKYSIGNGYTFSGNGCPDLNSRPRLSLMLRDVGILGK